jgi:hypothetical protein
VPPLLFSPEELPGEYFWNDIDTGGRLTLTAGHRFDVSEGGIGYGERNQGTWRLAGDRLLLQPERRKRSDQTYGRSTHFVPVKWDKRLYLVEENGMPAFCVEVANPSGRSLYQRYVTFPAQYLKRPADKPNVFEIEKLYPPLPPDSHPLIPARYRPFYERGPVHALVTRVSVSERPTTTRHSKTPVPAGSVHALLTGNAAQRDRFSPGLLLGALGSAHTTLLVLTVTTKGQALEANAVRLDLPGEEADKVHVGDKFSSGEYMCFPYGSSNDWPRWAIERREAWHEGK